MGRFIFYDALLYRYLIIFLPHQNSSDIAISEEADDLDHYQPDSFDHQSLELNR